MLRDIAKKYYITDNFNCAETLLAAANEQYALGLTQEDTRLIAAFGGGMGCGGTCGALAGSLSALGKMLLHGKAHDQAEFKGTCAELVKTFETKLGATDCTTLSAKYKTEENRCLACVQLAADVLEAFVKKQNGEAAPVTVTAEDIKRVKALGFLNCKGTDNFNCRVITRNGKITNAESRCMTEAAEKFGNGEMAMTTRLTVELQGIPYSNIEPLRAYLATAGLETGGTGSKVRPVVSCKGTTCQYGLYDTFAFSERIHQLFYKGYGSVKLPHKFKIALGGCPNNCVKPDLNDFGIIGQRVPIFDADKCKGCKVCAVQNTCPIKVAKVQDGKLCVDPEECNHCGRCVGKCPFHAMDESVYGFRICIGGRWGKRVAQGQTLDKVFTSQDEVIAVLEKAILLFREQGITGERFSDTIDRLGFENVQAQLMSDDLLARKADILGAEMHMVGGATC